MKSETETQPAANAEQQPAPPVTGTPPGSAPELDRRGVALPPRQRVGGIITPQ